MIKLNRLNIINIYFHELAQQAIGLLLHIPKCKYYGSMQQLGAKVLPTWTCSNKQHRLPASSDEWHDSKVGIFPSLQEGLRLRGQASLSCGFPSSV
jgi:hypothetical protein